MKTRAGKIASVVVGAGILTTAIVGTVTSNTPTFSTEEKVETIYYETVTTYDDTMREGTANVTQKGENGSKNVVYEVATKNGKVIERKKQSETIIKEAVEEHVTKGTKKYYTCSNGTEYDNLTDKNECENKVSWEKQRNAALQECNNDSSKTNCWYDEYPGTTVHWTTVTKRATTTTNNGRSGAICKDGWRSSATGRGACSHHGGVAYWI
ncbi:G5 domain-containing protein [Candidatus Saccharibacteria bacterium]|nr:G5 domain-containing protein [Candidatus Saccharibacteria bacterium]